jgi:hypothetical protein
MSYRLPFMPSLIQCQSMRGSAVSTMRDRSRLIRRRIAAGLAPFVLLLSNLGASAQQTSPAAHSDANSSPVFAEADAVRLLEELRRAFETENRSRFLKPFDAKRMPGYAAFRDQVAAFFARYGEFTVRYHVNQVTMDGELGGAMADFEFDARPRDGVTPSIRRRVALRLVCAWDGKQWKIADLSPRNWLE